MSNPNLAVKERLEKAAMSGDKEGVKACLAPDFVIYQSNGHPYGGTYKGADGFLIFMQAMFSAYAIEGLESKGVFTSDDPNSCVFEYRMFGKAAASGQKFDTTLLEHWRFRDGKVLSVKPCWFEIPGRATK